MRFPWPMCSSGPEDDNDDYDDEFDVLQKHTKLV